METLTEFHKRALKERWAVPHFNFATLEQLNGILDAARELKAPVILGTSEGERGFVGTAQALHLVKCLREKKGVPVFLNADHHKSYEAAVESIDAGYDSVHIDLSKKSWEVNLKDTKKVVEYAKNKDPNIEIEGELGYFATESSKIYKEIIKIPEDSYTQPEQAKEYVAKTGIDRLAPAVGNLHGIAVNKPQIRFELVKKLREVLPDVTFVIHGGSGISDKDMKRLVELGINNIHVSTELRVAYTDALRKELKEKPEEVAPYKYLDEARKAVSEIAKQKIKLFGANNRA